MRECGYTPQEKLVFHRFLARRRYPKFHIYASVSANKKTAVLNLHLDQKRPSYKGSHAHSAEYDGPVVENEAVRIQSFYS
ncbi:MAG: hypothetical protein UY45_C0001G0091 [Parcubacteria group bacterium GW2011_GWA1_49_26]|nr:MAG: hypothetical protein UY25_C0004G0027 [Candidatus Yanofskybacteria bacterium GW2011_GWC1_48_11]KKW04537.1 MAG: hypothetical protein UY38_C0001G0104 [Parcubacteria group bacterium GW2011_GWB1_49_12]KKW09205.1 MAG: hypothetical protein UY45_C0001G0091 [Parcubacteria group bacterium GW2011_GWA1_49_26]